MIFIKRLQAFCVSPLLPLHYKPPAPIASFIPPKCALPPFRRKSDLSAASPPSSASRFENALLINVVPFLWGSYGPAIKLLSEHVPDIPVLLLNFLCFVLAQLSISAARLFSNDRAALPMRAGIELGFYLFAGSLINLVALSYTSAPRVAFLVQLTTVFVPFLSFLRGALVERRVWQACSLALSGAFILAGEGFSLSLNLGDTLALIAALFYSVHVVRLDDVAAHEETLPLVDAKTRTQLILATSCLLVFAPHSTDFLRQLSVTDAATIAIGTLWVGAATTSAATCFQVAGQRRVGATRAAVFYASQPVWAALLAVVLRIDDMSFREVFGGALIVLAGVLLAVSRRTTE